MRKPNVTRKRGGDGESKVAMAKKAAVASGGEEGRAGSESEGDQQAREE